MGVYASSGKERTIKVLISSGWIGGAGGAERAMYSILRALEADDVDVVVRHRLGGPLGVAGDHHNVVTIRDWRWRGAARKAGAAGSVVQRAVNPLRRRLSPRYDVYLQFLSGMNLSSAATASVKLLVPSGNQVPDWVAQDFDYIALQAPDNARFVPDGARSILLPPPVLPLADESTHPTVALPTDYYLTVFNPYDPVKGLDDLARAAASSPRPIVWCHSQKTLSFDIPAELAHHPRVIHVDDPSPAEMKYLYENARAYLCFSKSEGFGWGIADALRHSRAIVSRRLGVLSFPQADVPRVIEVDEPWRVDWSLIETRAGDPDAQLEWIAPEAFRRRLLEVTR